MTALGWIVDIILGIIMRSSWTTSDTAQCWISSLISCDHLGLRKINEEIYSYYRRSCCAFCSTPSHNDCIAYQAATMRLSMEDIYTSLDSNTQTTIHVIPNPTIISSRLRLSFFQCLDYNHVWTPSFPFLTFFSGFT